MIKNKIKIMNQKLTATSIAVLFSALARPGMDIYARRPTSYE